MIRGGRIPWVRTESEKSLSITGIDKAGQSLSLLLERANDYVPSSLA